MSCQDSNDSLAFLGWTTEEGSGRTDYPVMQYDYIVTANTGVSPFEGMLIVYDVWGDVSERRNIVRFYMRFTEKNKYRLFFVKKPV